MTRTTHVQKQNSCLLRLSTDLLVHLLVTAVAAERAGGGHRLYSYALQLPLSIRLSHVCSLLRDVTLQTPSLWNTVDSEVFSSHFLLNAFLARSRDAPLDITVNADYLHIDRFKHLLPYAYRWRRLSVAGDDSCEDMFEDVLEEVRSVYAPNLTHFKIDTECDEVDVHSISATLTGGTPSLLSIHLNTYTFLLPRDLGGVKSLSLYNKPGCTPSANYDEFCGVLRSMPALVDLHINGEMATSWPSLRNVKPIPGLHLRSLRISPSEDLDRHHHPDRCLALDYLPSLLLTLSVDTLEYFALSNLSNEMLVFFIKTLRHGLLRFPHVRWLVWSVDLDETDEEDLDILVRSFPSVDTLNLSYFTEDHGCLQFLTEDPTAWPDLRAVHVQDANIAVLCDLISSRLQIGEPIRDAWVEKRRVAAALSGGGEDYVEWLKGHVNLRMGEFDGMPSWRFAWE